ncbi:DUF1800 domain-containing protein [Erythrobacter insulae]|uniref:DUF1800 domain-containing protein n=1 Tax=Erythrobacter insulae TaxID=2584124 RepID=A0A547PDB5_9SPHN|nr:DUF1800 domain-containing protein [Erythrobacter insulae]TRD12115.1 DUF1800 domain-containing protein [Erythrobacter insulae]
MTNHSWSIVTTRFGYGQRPSARPNGSPKAWLSRQVQNYDPRPARIMGLPDSEAITRQFSDFRLRRDQDAEAKRAARRALRSHVQDAIAARIELAVHTTAPFTERLVQFWANHFAVSTEKPGAGPLAGSFEAEAIRPYILGRFADMLRAAETHPSMLIYLDQAGSIGPNSRRGQAAARRGRRRVGLNENLAREILELHTLGVRSGYTQADVTAFAKALTGHTVPVLRRFEQDKIYGFDPSLHEPGPKTVLGKTYRDEGSREAMRILNDLADHPATARHLATKLARHFSADIPPPALVSRLEESFLATGGDLGAMTLTLIEAPEVWAETRQKFLTPWEWAIASLRAIDTDEFDPLRARRMIVNLGQDLWQPGSPAGFEDKASKWAAPETLHRRVEAAQTIGRLGARHDARTLGPMLYSGIWSENSATAVARAESPAQAMALMLASPEAMWR